MLRVKPQGPPIGFGALALFASLGTLLCCALPIALVALGLGSVVAAVTLRLPFLVTVSEYKGIVFGVAAASIALSAWLIWRDTACPADPELALRCRNAKRLGKQLVSTAVVLLTLGLFSAYLLLPLRSWLDI